MTLCLLDNVEINLSCFITDCNKLKKKLFYFNNLQYFRTVLNLVKKTMNERISSVLKMGSIG